jgi:hypothetical protein
MSAINRTKYAIGFEDAPIVLMDRVKNIAGDYITQASVSTITYRCDEYASQEDAEECSNGTEIIDDTALVVSSVVYNTLQTAAPWDSTTDATGYNVRFTLPASARTVGERWHRVEVNITPASGDSYPLVWIIETLAMGGT